MISEAERQVLIALIELEEPIETENNHSYRFYPQTLESAGAYFGSLREDWTEAFQALAGSGYILVRDGSYVLTEPGKRLARQERLDHPPIYYWYRAFYPMASNSRAFALFCKRLYGENLFQAGFSDLAQVRRLIEVGELGPQSRILDLGCGLGGVTEYISDCTGARAWGLDYSPEAIRLASERTQEKRSRLAFVEGNLDHLDHLPEKFDTLISIDTLYMPNRLEDTLSRMRSMLDPGGQMLVYYSHFAFQPGEPREALTPGGNSLGKNLAQLGLAYESWDFSEVTFHLMRRKHRLALQMAGDFEAEGSQALLESLLDESDSGDEPYHPDTNPYSRYLYRITC